MPQLAGLSGATARLARPGCTRGTGEQRRLPPPPPASLTPAAPPDHPPPAWVQTSSSSQRATAEVQQQFKELTLSPAQREGKEPVFEGRVTGGPRPGSGPDGPTPCLCRSGNPCLWVWAGVLS